MGALEQMSALGRPSVTDPMMDLLDEHHVTWDLLKSRAKTVDAGDKRIDIPVRTKRMPGGAYEYYDPLQPQVVEMFQVPQVQWRNHYVDIAISGDELLENSGVTIDELVNSASLGSLEGDGAQVVVNLMAAKMAKAEPDLDNLMSVHLWSSTASTGSKFMDTFQQIIINNTAAYAGKAASAFGTGKDGNNLWASIVNGTAGNTDLFDSDAIKTDRSAILRGRTTNRNDFKCIMDPDLFGGLEQSLGATAIQNPPNAELGYESITYRGLEFIEDNDSPANRATYINLQGMQLYKHAKRNYKLESWKQRDDQDSVSTRLVLRCQLICWDRRRQGARLGIDL
jgi:hypothetical protein